MQGIIFRAVEQLELASSLPDPKLETDSDVVVRLDLVGICGSDLHPFHGREAGLDPGTVMGHEGVGTILETGKAVRNFKRGDRVIIPFSTNCGRCFFCREGLSARCEQSQLFGWREHDRGLHGLQAQFARVPLADATLLPYPMHLSPIRALLLCDVVPTGVHATRLCREGSQSFAVIGCGPVGLSAIWALTQIRQCERVFAIDSLPERLALTREMGAIPLNFKTQDLAAEIREHTGGRGVDSAIEAVGTREAQRLGFDLVRMGGTLVSIGVHTQPLFSFSPVDAYNKNLTFATGRCPARALSESLVSAVADKGELLERLFTHQLPLAEGVHAYELFDKKRDGCVKVALRPN